MDFILLVIAQGFLKNSTTYTRLALASAVGGVWACVVETGIVKSLFVRDIFTYILVCSVMAVICLGRFRLTEVIKSIFVYVLLASAIGGAAGLLYWNTSVGYIFRTIALDSTGLFVCLLAAMIALTVVLREFFMQRAYGSRIHNVKIIFGGFVLDIKGLKDTGNVLYDPVYKMPVHVIEKGCLAMTEDELMSFLAEFKIHYIPFSSVGCSKGCMQVIMADSLYIEADEDKKGNKKSICLENVPVGLSETKLSSDGAYRMLINSEVMR